MIAVVGRESGKFSSKLKLSTKDVAEIIKQKSLGVKSKVLAKQFNVCVTTINRAYRLGH